MIRRPTFHRLRRSGPGALTVLHVPPGAAVDAARQPTVEWATIVWESYQDEHQTVRKWLRESGFESLP
jgi:hypothetical protein